MVKLEKGNLRKAFGNFATGVTVVATIERDGTPRGFTANSFSSVSLDPPLLLVCISKSVSSLLIFEQAGFFSVNILAETQREISNIFASQTKEKFKWVTWENGFEDMPLLSGSLACFVCKMDRCIHAGDHMIMIGEVVDFDHKQGSPLTYFRGRYASLIA